MNIEDIHLEFGKKIPREVDKKYLKLIARIKNIIELWIHNLVNENDYCWGYMSKDLREFIYKWDIWKKRTGNLDKKVVNKYIETSKTREWCQINFVTLSDYYI